MNNDQMTDEEKIDRKKFLTRLSVWSGAFAAALVSVPLFGSLLDPLITKKHRVWRKVGTLDQFAVGATNLVVFINADPEPYSGVTDRTAAWLRREAEDKFLAFSVNCTHLGCPVRWEEKAEMFMCPCHGGVYYADGTVAAGPPPRQLQQYAVRINGNDVEIKTSPVPLTGLTS